MTLELYREYAIKNYNNVKKMKYREVPQGQEYRAGFIREIIDVKHQQCTVNSFTTEEIDDILTYLCVT